MKQTLPYWGREDIEGFIGRPATALGSELRSLVPQLEAVARKYISAIETYHSSATRGEVMRSLAEVVEHSDNRLAGAISILGMDATRALMGRFPNAFLRFTGIDGDQHLAWIVDDEAVAHATFKSRMALQSLSGQPNLLKVRLQRTGIDFFNLGEEAEARAYLAAVASVDPALVRELVGSTIELLTEVFDLHDPGNARNIKVLDGARANADWQLMSLILDLVWPMERGELHSSKMNDLRELVNGVVRYVWGETRSRRGAPSRKDDGGKEEGDLLFDSMLLSGVLTLRHQIYSLIQALKDIEGRMQRLGNKFGDVVVRLDKIAYYPLLDWKRELERRLLFGDYRPKNPGVRRYTGEVVATPLMPRFKKDDDAVTRTLALIEAASPLVKGGRNTETDPAVLKQAFSI